MRRMLGPIVKCLVVVSWLVLGSSLQAQQDEETSIAAIDPSRSRVPTLFSWGTRLPDDDDGDDAIVTDRPHLSEASSLVGLGVWQIESGYTYFGNNNHDTRTNTSSLPETLLRAGLFVPWFEFRLGANFFNERTWHSDGSRDSNAGFDDLYLGAKLGLFQQRGWLPEVAIFPQTRVPVGQRELSDHAWLPGFNLAYSWVITDWLELECNTQLNRRREESGGFYAEVIQTANFEYQFTERLGGFTEWFGAMPNGADDSATGPVHYFHAGLVYLITPNIQVDVHAAKGLSDHSNDFFAGPGLSARF
ncbi:transporter [bacterium]|nr:transporter [bacterium]